MAARGVKPKPAALRIVDGTHRDDRHGNAEAVGKLEKSLAKPDKPPKWLTTSQKKHWRYFLKLIDDINVARMPDEVALGTMCVAFEDYLEASATLEEFGEYYVTTTKNGDEMVRRHPAAMKKKEAESRLMRMCPEFGMTPSGRARLAADLKDAPNDPSEKYFS